MKKNSGRELKLSDFTNFIHEETTFWAIHCSVFVRSYLLSETINVKRCRDKEICRVYCVKYPTPLHGSKTSSRKKSEELSASEYIKEDKKTSSAPVNSVNMGLNVIGISLLKLDQKKLINLFIARPCLTTTAKAHLSQRVLWKNCE